MPLPHRYPFRWLDGCEGGVARATIAGNSTWLRGTGGLPLPFCAELLAQGAALLLDPEPGASVRSRRLAAIERLVASRLAQPGDLIEVRVQMAGGFGGLTRIEGTLSCDGQPFAHGVLVLA